MSLDDHIAAWAATVRLSDADADAILARIVATPVRSAQAKPQLDASWWRTYNAGFAARMIASTCPARGLTAAARPLSARHKQALRAAVVGGVLSRR
jgi:hypothetical protein